MEAKTKVTSTLDRQSRIGTLIVMGVVAVLILGIVYVTSQPKGGTADGVTQVSLTGAAGEAPVVGKPAPDLALVTADGTTMKLSDLRGHPVWLTFGESWCQPCRAENPDIQATFAEHQGTGLEVVQVYLVPPQTPLASRHALVGFQRVHLAAGEQRHVHFMLSARDLSTVDEGGTRAVSAGQYQVFVGGGQPDSAPGVSADFAITGQQVLPH